MSALSKTTAAIKVEKSENHGKMATSLTVGSNVSKGKREKERKKRHTVFNLAIHRRTPTSGRNLLNHLLRQLQRPHKRTNDRLARGEEQHE